MLNIASPTSVLLQIADNWFFFYESFEIKIVNNLEVFSSLPSIVIVMS